MNSDIYVDGNKEKTVYPLDYNLGFETNRKGAEKAIIVDWPKCRF